MNILDQYVVRYPRSQNVVDLFEGEWSSTMPADSGLTSSPGAAGLFADDRVVWAEQMLGGFYGNDVLELGPLEGGHSYMLHERGAKSITAIEANSRAFLKCLCVKELFGLSRVKYMLGDFVSFLEQNERKFDVTFASGVLYHMADPMRVLDLILRSADKIYIWTHYFDERIIRQHPNLAKKFGPSQTATYAGHEYRYSLQDYERALDWAGFCGGPERTSRWLTRESVLGFIERSGFSKLDIAFEQTSHPNGPSLGICAQKS